MRVLLDTNVLASAVATRGLCADVLREVLADHELITCPQIFTELRRILCDKFAVTNELIEDFIGLLQETAVCVAVSDLPKLTFKDKDDLGILAAAKDGNANVIVTGDKELQRLRQFSGISILTPRQFWQQITQ
jgi:putative PIN family toxin of toxin-antitoxin system